MSQAEDSTTLPPHYTFCDNMRSSVPLYRRDGSRATQTVGAVGRRQGSLDYQSRDEQLWLDSPFRRPRSDTGADGHDLPGEKTRRVGDVS